MTVRTAIALINQARDEISGEEATGYDADTRFCIDWFEAFGMDGGKSGEAITMAQAYNIGIADLEAAGVFNRPRRIGPPVPSRRVAGGLGPGNRHSPD